MSADDRGKPGFKALEEIQARAQYDQMKTALGDLVERLPDCDDGVPLESVDALDEFTQRFP